MATASELIDFGKLGALLKRARKAAGYSSVEKYANAINEKTGVGVSPTALYKIERGEQEPKIYQIAAFSTVLFGDWYAPEMTAILHDCMCEGWQRIDREHARKTLQSVSGEIVQKVREIEHAKAVLR